MLQAAQVSASVTMADGYCEEASLVINVEAAELPGERRDINQEFRRRLPRIIDPVKYVLAFNVSRRSGQSSAQCLRHCPETTHIFVNPLMLANSTR